MKAARSLVGDLVDKKLNTVPEGSNICQRSVVKRVQNVDGLALQAPTPVS